MTDTVYADISEFQILVNDTYPHSFLAFRSNDADHKDLHFDANLHWAEHAVKTRRLAGFIVYFVWRPGVQDGYPTLRAQLGNAHRPRMAIMIDVESWGGQIRGDHSAALNTVRHQIVSWLNHLRPAWQRGPLLAAWYRRQDRRRVIGYGNAGDLHEIWPTRPGVQIVLADYTRNPAAPVHLVHQYTDDGACRPFGHCDLNSADGLSPTGLARKLGLMTLTSRLG